MCWLKKSEKKKESIKMSNDNEIMGGQSAVDEEVAQIFGRLDESYAEVKRSIQQELCEYKDMLARANNQANIYKNKVQVRDVMEELLPILSEILNDVQDGTALDVLKETLSARFKQMKTALKRVGIELLLHERNKPVDGSEKLNVSSVQPTNDSRMHQCVAFSNKMGCIIKGEEDNPILEDVALFQFSKTERQKTIRENETPRQSPIQQRETIQHRPSAEGGQPVSTCMKPDIKTNQNANQERTVTPDFDIIDKTCIKLNKPISLCVQDRNVTLFKENARLVIGKGQPIQINLPYNAQQNPMYLYLETKLLDENFRIYGSDVYYFVELNVAARKAILRLYCERDEYDRLQHDEYGRIKKIQMKEIELIGR